MIISRIIRRSICSVSFTLHKKPLESAACNRFQQQKQHNFTRACFVCFRLLYKEPDSFLIKKKMRRFSIYDGDGKTVGFILNKKTAQVMLIDAFKTDGFTLSNGLELVGPVIIFPHSILSWNITTAEDVNEDSLVLFKLIEPKVDVLVFGFGCSEDYTAEVKERFTKACKNLGIKFEALPTEHAVGTYNFLAEERRFVAGALIPPTKLDKLRFDRSLSLMDELENGLEAELPAIEAEPVKLLK